ncbi:hypothetical protein [Streptomyces sp. NPDC015131]|uniref:hypothetical protein n=1 Tax=Streptomyces sp. NPDC015131 TaxID=3364941 RepID=UPI0036F8D012
MTTIISAERRGNFLGLIQRFWESQGYKITTVHAGAERPRMYAKSPDGYGISLVFGHKGQAFFEVATPCVSKSTVAPPTTPPNGPAYPPGEIPTPNVRSAFWSADTPVPAPRA